MFMCRCSCVERCGCSCVGVLGGGGGRRTISVGLLESNCFHLFSIVELEAAGMLEAAGIWPPLTNVSYLVEVVPDTLLSGKADSNTLMPFRDEAVRITR